MKPFVSAISVLFAIGLGGFAAGLTYPIVDTGQEQCYDNSGAIAEPQPNRPFYGQDAQHHGNTPSYRDNGDSTVSDLVTGLMWVRARGEKVSWQDATSGAKTCRAGGYSDWRMPTWPRRFSARRCAWRRGAAE